MVKFNKILKLAPYLYFIAVIATWFTVTNKSQGLIAYPILIIVVPFLWQLIKPSNTLNFSLGITTVCLSSYVIIAHMASIIDVAAYALKSNPNGLYSWSFVLLNFFMAVGIVRNSIKTSL